MATLFTVKCFSCREIFYNCKVEGWVQALATAHLLAEVYGHRANVYREGESTHCYNASGNPDITQRCFT